MSETDLFLLPQHKKLIDESGISVEVSRDRGYRSVTTTQELSDLGFSPIQRRVPTLLLPVWNVAGEIILYQSRPDEPRIRDGKPLKYETPKGSSMVIDVPSSVRDQLADPSVPLVITEGIRKADAAASHGICCIALLGVWNWRGRNAFGGTTVLADFESIALKGREVFIAFDSDVTTNPAVARALQRLQGFLESRKAVVRTILLPAGSDGEKVGLDDYLAAGHTTEDLFRLMSDSVPDLTGPAALRNGIYGIVDGCLAYVKRTFDTEEWFTLANFSAEITEEIIADDGVEERGVAVVAGRLWNGVLLPPQRVALEKFESLQWISPGWGTTAIVAAGNGSRDRTREAIQRLSFNVVRRREYAHSGWRHIDGEWVFLSHGMAIGTDGSRADIRVHLDGAGQLLALPDPRLDTREFAASVAATIGLLDVAPDGITVPLLGAALRAVLNEIGYADLTVFLVGPSGALKSEMAAQVQRFFGHEFSRLTLPASWAGTSNFLERIASDFKDCVLVIDDFAPAGTAADVRRYHATADRVIRGAGNASGRGRMNADSSLRPSYTPRALIVSTGEDVPQGFSIRARMLVVEMGKGDVDRARLARFQHGEDGLALSRMMSSYVQWLAPRIESLRSTLPPLIRRFRADLSRDAEHSRAPDALANLAAAWHLWLDFAVDQGAMTPAARDGTWARVWAALRETGGEQAVHLDQEHPVTRFLDLLRGCLASGAAHVAGPDGKEPAVADAWGWREVIVGPGTNVRAEWRPQGRRVGWIDDSGLYLEPQAVYSTVQQMGQTSGTSLTISPQTLWKRLDEAGLLCSTDLESRNTRMRRKVFANARPSTLHLAPNVLEQRDDEVPEPVADDARYAADVASGQVRPPNGQPDEHQADHENRQESPWIQAIGQDGQVGQAMWTGEGESVKRCARCGTPLPSRERLVCDSCAERWTA